LDIALCEGEIDNQRMQDLEEPMKALIADSGDSDEGSEGRDTLDYLLSATLSLDHGLKRTVRELIVAEVKQETVIGLDSPASVLGRYGIYVDNNKSNLALRTGKATPTAGLYANSKWCNGAHSSALQKLEGVVRPTSAIRIAPNEQHRIILVPLVLVGLSVDE
jgi:hypothetical protein